MKTIKTEREVKTADYTYACEVCDFTSTSQDNVYYHEYKEHSYTKETKIDDEEFLWFDSEEAFNRYRNYYTKGRYENEDMTWLGAGWYRLFEEHRPDHECGYTVHCLEPAAARVKTLNAKAVRLQQRASKIEALVGGQS